MDYFEIKLAETNVLLKQMSAAEPVICRAVKEQFSRHGVLFLVQSDGGEGGGGVHHYTTVNGMGRPSKLFKDC